MKEIDRELKGRQDQYVIKSANKPVLQKAAIALDPKIGLAETALNLLLRADVKELSDERNPRERPGAMWELYLLLGMGRLEEVDEALTADPQAERPYDKA